MERAAFAALALFVFAIPWERTVGVPFFGGAGTPFGLVAAVLTVLSLFSSGRLRLRAPSLVLLLMALFVSWSAVSYFWSIEPARTLVSTARYAQLLIMVWLIWQLGRSAARVHALMQAYVLGAYVSLLLVALSYVRGTTFAASSAGLRYSFDGANPNYLALTLALGIPLAWHLFSTRHRIPLQVLNALYVVFAVFVIALTASRGGFAAAVVALLIVPLSLWRLGAVRQAFVLVAYASLAYAAYGLVPGANVERISSVATSDVVDGLGTRTRIWSASLTLLEHEPNVLLRGAGAGTHPGAVAPHLGRRQEAHNGFLSLAVESGLVGLGLFVLFLLVAVLPNVGLEPNQRIFFLVLAMTMVVTLLPANWEDQKALWFGIALLTSRRAFVMSSFRLRRPAPEARAATS